MAVAGAGKKAGGSKGGKKADRDLDLANCGRGVWLVKVPKYIVTGGRRPPRTPRWGSSG
jgi:hypothetical protein